MFRKLLPREDDFFDFFTRHAAVTVKGAEKLVTLFKTGQGYPEIKACEEEADQITHQCVDALHKNFITPFERGDIHRLISKMDDILDEINDVGKYLLVYKIKVVESEALKMSEIIVKASDIVLQAVTELRKGKRTPLLKECFLSVSNLEQESDALYASALARLFDHENNVITLIKWREIYEHLEEAVDACDDVLNILEGIILEHE